MGKLIGKNIAVSRLTFGQPAGVVQFTYLFEHMGELDQSQEKITSDAATAEYGSRAAELFEGAPADNIGRLVASTIQEPRPVMNVISAVTAPGKAADIMAFGMEMHQLVTAVTGAPAAFVVSVSGAFGGTRSSAGSTDRGVHVWAVYLRASQEARCRGDRRAGTDHLLLALLEDPTIEAVLGVSLQQAREALASLDQDALNALGIGSGTDVPPLPTRAVPKKPTFRAVMGRDRLRMTSFTQACW